LHFIFRDNSSQDVPGPGGSQPVPAMQASDSIGDCDCFTLENTVVKGYHYFQIKPPVTNPLTQLPVIGNIPINMMTLPA